MPHDDDPLPPEITRTAWRSSNGELAWRRADLPAAIEAVSRAGLAILGGEVWLVRGTGWTGLIPDRRSDIPGVWSWDTSERRAGEEWQAYCDRCASEFTEAINNMRLEEVPTELTADLWFNLTYVSPDRRGAT